MLIATTDRSTLPQQSSGQQCLGVRVPPRRRISLEVGPEAATEQQLAQQQQAAPTSSQQQQQQQQHMAADDPTAKVQALNSAFCHRIYSTALQHLQHQYSPEVVAQQFMDILEQDDPYDSPCSVAHQDVNCSKNRYRDVVPYDHNRVALPPLSNCSTAAGAGAGACSSSSSGGSSSSSGACGPAGSTNSGSSSNRAAGDSTYINASFMCDPRQSADAHALGYIGTQGPLPCTMSDFWRMVAATNTSAIVMLTGLTDGSPTLGNSRPRCAPYFPEKEQEVLRLPDNTTITCVHKNNLDENVHFRQLEVVYPASLSTNSSNLQQQQQPQPQSQQPFQHQHQLLPQQLQQQQQFQQQQQQQRLWINHYQYPAWPDYGVPSSTSSVLALCHALDGCRRTGCKIAVHCSAGVGRTGTFIAIDILLHRLHSLTLQLHGSVTDADIRSAMDIPAFVASLRKQRRGTVQTGEQYAFIWQAVMDELEMLLQEQQQLREEQQLLQLEQQEQLLQDQQQQQQLQQQQQQLPGGEVQLAGPAAQLP